MNSITIGSGRDIQTIFLDAMQMDVSIFPTGTEWDYRFRFWNGGYQIWMHRPKVCRLFKTRNAAMLASARWLQNIGVAELHTSLCGLSAKYCYWNWSLTAYGEPMIITSNHDQFTAEGSYAVGRQFAKLLGFALKRRKRLA